MEDKRERLLKAAESVFGERGLAGATVAEIAKEADVAKGTFYLYFDSKDALVAAMQRRLSDELLERSRVTYEALDDAGWWDVVDAYVETIVDFDIEHREWVRVAASSVVAALPSREQAQREERMLDVLVAAIRRGVEQGECATTDPEYTALVLAGGLETLCHRIVAAEGRVDRNRLIAASREVVHKALAVPGP